MLLGIGGEIVRVERDHPGEAVVVFSDGQVAALAADSHVPGLIYCGTHDCGLWRSRDSGISWQRIGEGAINHVAITAIAVSPLGESGSPGVLYAGTEPSALYRTADGGDSWAELDAMQRLPSSTTWSFPPQPETHHVRWINAHPVFPKRLVVAIEAGALIHTNDGGQTWIDRAEGGPYDTHTALILPDRPDRITCAAGDGFFESLDFGTSWRKPEEGLPWRYCWSMVADSHDPHLILMSVAPGPREGHAGGDRARSAICRRYDKRPWIMVSDGLPDEQGMSLSALASDPARPNTFYALNNRGLYESTDGGWAWERLDIPWDDRYTGIRPAALLAIPD